jgi:23S rRNA pseudouridine2604 synthase
MICELDFGLLKGGGGWIGEGMAVGIVNWFRKNRTLPPHLHLKSPTFTIVFQNQQHPHLMSESQSVRINKYLSEVGFCSRREADKLIEKRRVTINGVVPEMGTKVTAKDVVRVDGKVISKNVEEAAIYIAFNKPVGIVSTTDSKGEKDNIIDYINFPKRIFPIGRLDKASEGLILLTSDGDIVNKILRARNNHEKEYIVTVDQAITPAFIQKMGNGIPILDTVTNNCFVEQMSKYKFRIILTQGLNRQIRRMCEYLGYEVEKLKRIRIMNIELDVPVGEWRYLTAKELNEINKMVSHSSKTYDDVS